MRRESHGRFALESGHLQRAGACPLSAKADILGVTECAVSILDTALGPLGANRAQASSNGVNQFAAQMKDNELKNKPGLR